MAATLKTPTTKIKTYGVNGKTLAEIWEFVKKRGPIDPNDKKRVCFLTTTQLKFNPDRGTYKVDGRITVDRKSGWFDAKVKVERLEMVLESEVLCPKRNVRGLSLKAMAEWIRFYACAMVHEGEHVQKAIKESKKIVDEINRLRGTGLGETEKKAAEAAVDDLKTKIFDDYIRGMDQRFDKIHKDFDKSTKHGETKGAKLDTSIV